MYKAFSNKMKCFHYFKDRTKSRVQRSEPILKAESNFSTSEDVSSSKDRVTKSSGSANSKDRVTKSSGSANSPHGIIELYEENAGKLRVFKYAELRQATNDFTRLRKIGEGGFGCVYKGRLESGKVVAVKHLNLDGLQGNQEFIVEVLMLSLLRHSNLVTLIGYCTDGDQRVLVYEYMPLGSLENHLFDLEPDQEPLDWHTRLKIAVGAAHGLEYLHCKANPPVIYRDLKSSNILLDKDFNPKLSDFGLAKLAPVGDKTHVSTRVMGTYGYCAPEYAVCGKLTIKSDIYSFGVVLLELITGRKAIDTSKKPGEQNLVAWSRPFLKDRKKFVQLVDPLLQGRFSVRSVHHVVAVTAMCLQEQANFRPLIGDIVVALEYLASQADISGNLKSSTVTSQQLSSKHYKDQVHEPGSRTISTAT